MDKKRVVVTGIGLVTPLGHQIDEFWQNCINGVSASVLIDRFDTEKFKTKFACQVQNFTTDEYIDRKEARRMDLYAQYALVATGKAVDDAKLNIDELDKENCGVIWASGIGGITTFEEEITSFVRSDFTPRFSPFFIPKMIPDIAAGLISMKYGFMGVNFATVSACASSSNAIGCAFDFIRNGREKLIITGGSEAPITPGSIGGFNAMKALSENNEEYKTASRPFDSTRDGFVMGEGGVCLILEEYEHALARGAKIYAEIVGAGFSADAHHLTAPHPEGLGARLVMQNCLKDAGLQPEDVDYVNVHGTATPLGDLSETKAIIDLFKDHAFKLNISATKSMHGHLLGAAGAIESAISVLSIVHDMVPPTINNQNRDPEIHPDLNLTLNKAQQRKVNVAISNTFGFGGHNVCLAFKKI
ncbi:MAG TPA: beta-ketoacyl-ACP synthase II [Bacteroidia bacterium]|nr:beta-ketoacyl-ACP synthase II [Bacteroidia bacterium]HRS60027.1 beta-ketoacyl-ACP synthase II [Bacteroidia bacterium]HRU68942.1 beta-ketoacyl-ACP synthase II [Bacteroidia bacterium]